MIGDARVELVAIIKGSGMIAPDMATMLGYIFTVRRESDAAFLQRSLEQANARTFPLQPPSMATHRPVTRC